MVQAYDGPGAVEAFAATDATGAIDGVAAVLLDVMLPGFDGLEVCRRIQSMRPVPVLMITARDDETDKLIGLGVGADDYMTKPFSGREVVARVRALLRRVERAAQLAASTARLTADGIELDPSARRVHVDGAPVHLTPLEFDLLALLLTEPGRVRTRDELVREVWGWADSGRTRTLDSHVRALRAKVGRDRIRTVHGVGYAVGDGR